MVPQNTGHAADRERERAGRRREKSQVGVVEELRETSHLPQ